MRLENLLALSLLFQVSISAAFARDISGELQVANLKRHYLLHLPPRLSAAPHPLLIMLHGGMENGAVIRKLTRMNELADREHFIVAYPYGSGVLKRKFLMWNAIDCCGYAVHKKVDDVAFVAELIDKLIAENNVDPSRVFVCGYSNGAMLALRLAAEIPEKLSAIASVGGSMSGKEKLPELPVSVLMIHGTDDRHVPYEGGTGKWAKQGYPVNDKSVSYAISFWKRADKCSETPELSEKEHQKIETYKGKNNTEVKLITLLGARHNWPGGRKSLLYTDKSFDGLDASRESWDFFLKHPRQN
ncbi:MAG: alpha/beta fold hydrolase [Candidatus Obscuribacterales bacterium]|nr:alpha/beta fold hydrolase [Candidatus Obscuribacterales bacterium]